MTARRNQAMLRGIEEIAIRQALAAARASGKRRLVGVLRLKSGKGALMHISEDGRARRDLAFEAAFIATPEGELIEIDEART